VGLRSLLRNHKRKSGTREAVVIRCQEVFEPILSRGLVLTLDTYAFITTRLLHVLSRLGHLPWAAISFLESINLRRMIAPVARCWLMN